MVFKLLLVLGTICLGVNGSPHGVKRSGVFEFGSAGDLAEKLHNIPGIQNAAARISEKIQKAMGNNANFFGEIDALKTIIASTIGTADKNGLAAKLGNSFRVADQTKPGTKEDGTKKTNIFARGAGKAAKSIMAAGVNRANLYIVSKTGNRKIEAASLDQVLGDEDEINETQKSRKFVL